MKKPESASLMSNTFAVNTSPLTYWELRDLHFKRNKAISGKSKADRRRARGWTNAVLNN